jgi:hypothetical protein
MAGWRNSNPCGTRVLLKEESLNKKKIFFANIHRAYIFAPHLNRKKMKKISFVIAACTLFVFAACGGNDAAAEETVDSAAVEATVEEAPVEEAAADTSAAEAPVAEEAAAE